MEILYRILRRARFDEKIPLFCQHCCGRTRKSV